MESLIFRWFWLETSTWASRPSDCRLTRLVQEPARFTAVIIRRKKFWHAEVQYYHLGRTGLFLFLVQLSTSGSDLIGSKPNGLKLSKVRPRLGSNFSGSIPDTINYFSGAFTYEPIIQQRQVVIEVVMIQSLPNDLGGGFQLVYRFGSNAEKFTFCFSKKTTWSLPQTANEKHNSC